MISKELNKLPYIPDYNKQFLNKKIYENSQMRIIRLKIKEDS